MTTVYHVTSIFQPTTEATRAQFDDRITLIGRRIEKYIKRCLYWKVNDEDDLDNLVQDAFLRLWKLYQANPPLMDYDDKWWVMQGLRGAEYAFAKLKYQTGTSAIISLSAWNTTPAILSGLTRMV